MKKILTFIITILIGCVFLFWNDLVKPKPTQSNPKTKNTNKSIQDIQQKITDLKNTDWDKNLFDAVNSDIQVHKNLDNITSTDALNLISSLNSTYIIKLQDAVREWKNNFSDCKKPTKELINEVDKMYQENIQALKNQKKTLNGLYKVYNLEKKVNKLLAQKYNGNSLQNLENEIKATCKDYIKCSDIKNTQNDLISNLRDFETFCAGIQDDIDQDYYKICNESDSLSTTHILKFDQRGEVTSSDPDIYFAKKYQYYKDFFDEYKDYYKQDISRFNDMIFIDNTLNCKTKNK